MAMRLSELTSYPLKSGGACSHTTAPVETRGLQWDRRWMLVDAEGSFLTARTYPRLLRLKPTLDALGHLTLSDPSGRRLENITPDHAQKRQVLVWSDRCEALGVNGHIDRWFSEFLGFKTHLVFMPDSSRRLVDGPNAQADDLVGFADGFPLLLTHQASLNDLNARMKSPVPMSRFRPNLVVEGGAAFSELSWSRIQIGQCEFVTGGPCVRCSMTTVDAKAGKPVVGGEPPKLCHYQRTEKGAFLELTSSQDDWDDRVGDSVEVLETRDTRP